MENRINFGELDTLVLLRSCVITYGTQGAKKYTFQDYERVYAKVDRNVAENVTNTNLEEGQEITLTIYKVKALTTRWRVVVEGRSYEITGIDPISRVSPLCHICRSSMPASRSPSARIEATLPRPRITTRGPKAACLRSGGCARWPYGRRRP